MEREARPHGDGVAQRLDERLVRDRRAFVGTPVEDGPARLARPGGQLRRQPRLADAGLAVHERHAGTPVEQAAGEQVLELAGAGHEWRLARSGERHRKRGARMRDERRSRLARGGRQDRRVMPEDGALEIRQRRAGLEPEL